MEVEWTQTELTRLASRVLDFLESEDTPSYDLAEEFLLTEYPNLFQLLARLGPNERTGRAMLIRTALDNF